MHAKLDELIAATHSAKNEFVGIEEREEEEIVELKEEVKDAVESVRADATKEATTKSGRERNGAFK
jgi:low affinity Fe/Cu permease